MFVGNVVVVIVCIKTPADTSIIVARHSAGARGRPAVWIVALVLIKKQDVKCEHRMIIITVMILVKGLLVTEITIQTEQQTHLPCCSLSRCRSH